MRSRLMTVAVAVVALSVAGVASARPTAHVATAARAATTVDVKAKEFSFVLSRKAVPQGTVTFVLKNVGHATHDFAIDGHTSKIIGPGKTTTLTVTLSKPGRYQYTCTVDDHASLGMKGVLRVT